MKIKTATKLFAALALASGGTAMADAPRTLLNGRPACGNVISNCEGKCPALKEPDAKEIRACEAALAAEIELAATKDVVATMAKQLRVALSSIVAPPIVVRPPTIASIK